MAATATTVFTRDQENRLHELRTRKGAAIEDAQATGGKSNDDEDSSGPSAPPPSPPQPPLTEDEVRELAELEIQYTAFLEEGERRLREAKEEQQGGSDAVPSTLSTVTSAVSSAASHVYKGTHFWGSLVGTFVPGYVCRKLSVTTGFEHWNWVGNHLVLGALPVMTAVGSSGNHLEQLKAQCAERKVSVGLVVSCIEPEEFNGFGVGLVNFATPQHWRETLNVEKFIQVPLVDGTATEVATAAAATSAKTEEQSRSDGMFLVVKGVVEAMHDAMAKGEVVYVHCKAGKGRSWMVVMCYLMTYSAMPFDLATEHVRKARHQVNPSKAQIDFARAFAERWNREHPASATAAPASTEASSAKSE